MNKINKLAVSSWGDRFAIMNHYNPADDVACDLFGLTPNELAAARDLLKAGSIAASKNIDVTQYASHFVMPTAVPESNKPESATKKVAVLKKRGRKGVKIHAALLAVPTEPVDVKLFMAQHGVSLPVLRQANNRFSREHGEEYSKQVGTINVRQDKTTKQLMIWKTLA